MQIRLYDLDWAHNRCFVTTDKATVLRLLARCAVEVARLGQDEAIDLDIATIIDHQQRVARRC